MTFFNTLLFSRLRIQGGKDLLVSGKEPAVLGVEPVVYRFGGRVGREHLPDGNHGRQLVHSQVPQGRQGQQGGSPCGGGDHSRRDAMICVSCQIVLT